MNPVSGWPTSILTDNLPPSASLLKIIRGLPFPVLLCREDIYAVASKVHDLIVKTHYKETEKIALIRDLIAEHVDVKQDLEGVMSGETVKR